MPRLAMRRWGDSLRGCGARSREEVVEEEEERRRRAQKEKEKKTKQEEGTVKTTSPRGLLRTKTVTLTVILRGSFVISMESYNSGNLADPVTLDQERMTWRPTNQISCCRWAYYITTSDTNKSPSSAGLLHDKKRHQAWQCEPLSIKGTRFFTSTLLHTLHTLPHASSLLTSSHSCHSC